MSLRKYREKRVFDKTPEPATGKMPVKPQGKPLEFCVQKHAARRLHYDFRLEHKGVLLSWAIPKGPSMNPQDKRLAIHVEDHPFEYRHFEGIIPKGNYGAGTVEIWDAGTYTVPGTSSRAEAEKSIAAGLAKGHIEVELHGKKLKGVFALVKIETENKDSWLFIKKKDEQASSPSTPSPIKSKAKKTKKPDTIKPMLCTLIEEPFDNPEWLFEIKWDGYRALAYMKNGQVELRSRNQHLFNPIFPKLIADLSTCKDDVILDGEIVILDEKGRSHFQSMQNYQNTLKGDLHYYVFDLLYFQGSDLRNLPLIERKESLKQFLDANRFSLVHFSDHVKSQGKALFQQAVKQHLEGIIGKKIDSEYSSTRSRSWVKIKTHSSQEAVIGGFTAPRGSRKKFGALLLGVYEGNTLIYVGHTGGGFDSKSLELVYSKLEPLIQQKCPFSQTPKPNAPVTWVKPKLVCAISFTEWTNEGIARHPIFDGLRLDKKPKEVKRELASKEVDKKKPAPKEKNSLSNLDKIYWPGEKYTKGDLIEYYHQIAPYILPYLKNRPITLKRFPDGIEGNSFFQKDTSNLKLPEEVHTVTIHQESRDMRYIVIDNLTSLEYVVNLGAIELHPFLSQIDSLENPDFIVIDLDPVEISFDIVIAVAQEIHALLDELKIKNYCKTSGKRGLHICIPLQHKYTFSQAKQFAQILATIVHQRMPKWTSLERKPANRRKKVYLDYHQNNFGQTVIVPYGVRAEPKAPVSTPLKWDEVKKGLNPREWTIKTVPSRLKAMKDIFKPVLGSGVNIEAIVKRLEE